ncbi:MAG: hypothetical protein A3G59_02485 [Candidatus Taylorbacteria bacterium RIFCSPLOWO2_12_FULL_47_20]|uniref:Uncharacterized protein n=2 Tax=Candidatus Tayloriibacteriota TaxID=1817919 RepID=A0A1G2P8E4_9BACT|nr:MAG: hypothetical protein A3H68_00205 [Candidatus Taylorbacteria bacterium RIFCSPLOWO2_02_FULL_46_40]OHA44543.1 MAG: hypothetical protein A3G59_02485 [Candidatus Taylorbacteria bacterium RIFCSPLOWO2_12_FULL_47_20]
MDDTIKAIWGITIGAMIVVLLIAIFGRGGGSKDLDDGGIQNWRTFKSAKFGFEIKYPPSWRVSAYENDLIAPKFNFYPAKTSKKPPFDHFSETTNVSVFPDGIPTEGVFGETKDDDFEIGVPLERATRFVLEDGKTWAVFAVPKLSLKPESWSDAGFIWVRADISGLTTACSRDGEYIGLAECDPFEGDKIMRQGRVDDQEWKLLEQILSTFKFAVET